MRFKVTRKWPIHFHFTSSPLRTLFARFSPGLPGRTTADSTVSRGQRVQARFIYNTQMALSFTHVWKVKPTTADIVSMITEERTTNSNKMFMLLCTSKNVKTSEQITKQTTGFSIVNFRFSAQQSKIYRNKTTDIHGAK